MLTGRRRHWLLAILVVLLFSLTGCWDRIEIENRGYVLGVAIDHAAGPKGQYDLLYSPQAAGQRKYRVTFELPKFRKATESKEISSGQSHLIWAGEGESVLAITRAVNTKTYFGMFFEDMQIIVISEAVAREGIADVLDLFQRDAETRRKVKIFVAPGRAEDILTAKLQVEEVNSLFIGKLVRNVDKSPYFASKVEMGYISKAIRGKRSFVLPMVFVEGKEVKLAKAAVFNKDAKMVGVLDELEDIGGKIIRKNLRQGVMVVPNPADPNKVAVFELYEPDIKVNTVLVGDKLRVVVEAMFYGTLGENMEVRQDAYDRKFKEAVERAVEEEYTRLASGTYARLQQLGADVCELGDCVHRQHPQYWKKVKDRWDEEVFPSVPLDVKINVVIRRPVIMR